MAKTNITAYDMQELFKGIFYNNDYDYNIVIVNENTNEQQEVSVLSFLKTDFYTYSKDLRENLSDDGYGFNFPNLDTWLNSRGNTSTSYAHVELDGIDVVSSEDIDMGSATANITFVVPMEKIDILEAHISKLRLLVAGVRQEFVNQDGELLSFYASLGEVKYDQEPFDSAIGKCVIVSVSFNIAFMQDAFSSNQNNMEISLDGLTFEHLYYNKITDNIIFSGKPNLISNKAYANGQSNVSVSYSVIISYWIFIKDNVQLQINAKLKSIVNDDEQYTDSINIPIWIREYIPIYEDGEYSTKQITTKMVITNYTTNKMNSDFINVSLALNRFR